MILIGEKLNATLKPMKKAVDERDSDYLRKMAIKQVEAGADYIDINVATGMGGQASEVEAMKWAVEVLEGAVDKPLSIDSADIAVLEAGVETVTNDPPLLNSTSAETDQLESVMGLVEKHGCSVIALSFGEEGPGKGKDERLSACRKVAEMAGKLEVPPERIFFDPQAIPLATEPAMVEVFLDTCRAIKGEHPGAKTVIGLSNISFGLPNRTLINNAFLALAILAGLDAAILNPMAKLTVPTIYTAEALSGKDPHCGRYLKAFRKGLIPKKLS